jgi:hypothetical protein
MSQLGSGSVSPETFLLLLLQLGSSHTGFSTNRNTPIAFAWSVFTARTNDCYTSNSALSAAYKQSAHLRKDCVKAVATPLQCAAIHGQRKRHVTRLAVDAQAVKEAHKVGVRCEVEHLRDQHTALAQKNSRLPQPEFNASDKRVIKASIQAI